MDMDVKDIEDSIDRLLDLDDKEYLITIYFHYSMGVKAHTFTKRTEVFEILTDILKIMEKEDVQELTKFKLEMDIDKIVWMG